MKKKKLKKPFLGRIPIAPPGVVFKDKKKYTRKKKHKDNNIECYKNCYHCKLDKLK